MGHGGTAENRHLDVQQDQIWQPIAEQAKTLLAVVGVLLVRRLPARKAAALMLLVMTSVPLVAAGLYTIDKTQRERERQRQLRRY